MISPRGYGALLWDHGRSLEAEAELADWLLYGVRPGKVIPFGLGPAFREHFKHKFRVDVFSTPDLVYVPEFRDGGGEIVGYGPPLAFDVTERPQYAWKGGPRTVFAQVSKTDDLARFDKETSFLAYKWKDGVWTFARIADIVALKLRPVWVDTVIGGVKSKQKNYLVPRELWYGQDEFRALILEEIKNSEPIDHVKFLRMIDKAREDDMEKLVALFKDIIGVERLREFAKYVLAMQPMTTWNPARELEPTVYILQRVLESVLGTKRRRGRGRGGIHERKTERHKGNA